MSNYSLLKQRPLNLSDLTFYDLLFITWIEASQSSVTQKISQVKLHVNVHKSMSIKEQIQIYEFDFSAVNMLHLNAVTAMASAVIIGIISLIGIIIKGFFMYYVQYKAPKDRPINRMIFFDQVINVTQYIHYISHLLGHFWFLIT